MTWSIASAPSSANPFRSVRRRGRSPPDVGEERVQRLPSASGQRARTRVGPQRCRTVSELASSATMPSPVPTYRTSPSRLTAGLHARRRRCRSPPSRCAARATLAASITATCRGGIDDDSRDPSGLEANACSPAGAPHNRLGSPMQKAHPSSRSARARRPPAVGAGLGLVVTTGVGPAGSNTGESRPPSGEGPAPGASGHPRAQLLSRRARGTRRRPQAQRGHPVRRGSVGAGTGSRRGDRRRWRSLRSRFPSRR